MTDVTDQLYRDGTKLALNKQYRDAIFKFVEILKIDPLDDRALVAKGVCHTHLQEYKSAYEEFNEALKINPNNKRALDNLDVVVSRVELEMPVLPPISSPPTSSPFITPNPPNISPPATHPMKIGGISQTGFAASPYQVAGALDPLVIAVRSNFKGISLYQVIRTLFLGALGGVGIGSLLFPIAALFFLRWPIMYVVSMVIVWGILGVIILIIVGHFWKKTELTIKNRLEPLYGITILGVMLLDLYVTTTFYMK